MRADADSSDTLLSRLSRGYFLRYGWLERLPVLITLVRPSEKGRRAAAVAIGGPAAEVRKTRVDVDTNCFRAALTVDEIHPKTNLPSHRRGRQGETEEMNQQPSQNGT